MSRLRERIIAQAGNSRAAAAGSHPAGTPDTPMSYPGVHVWYAPTGIQVRQAGGFVTNMGAVVPYQPTAPGGAVHTTANRRRG
jgi:hypothetical protein